MKESEKLENFIIHGILGQIRDSMNKPCCKSPELKKLHAIMDAINALFEHMPELENYLKTEQMEILAQLSDDVLTEIGRIHYNKSAE